jgi:phage baseplate assembly protein W
LSFITTTSRIVLMQSELVDPFSVNSHGEIADTYDPSVWAKQHLLAIILTTPGERVMRPRYGVGLINFVFDNQDPLRIEHLSAAIKNGVAEYEPSIQVRLVRITANAPTDGVAQIGIDYTVLNSAVIHSFVFSTNGQTVEV